MKIKNRFVSRLFAGFIVATVIATSTPISALAEEISPASEVVEIVESEEASEMSVAEDEAETDDAIDETIDEEDTEVSVNAENEENTGISEEFVEDFEEESETDDVVDIFFEEMTEAAQDALPASTVCLTTSEYAPYAKVRWRKSSTSVFSPVEKGCIRFITQNTDSKLYCSGYWPGGWPEDMIRSECGTACHSMALSYLGINKTGGYLLTLGGGLSRLGNSFTSGITNLPYGTQWGTNPSATQLKTCINNYIKNSSTNPAYSPVFFHVSQYPSASGGVTSHYMLVIGYKGGSTYETLDPWDNSVTSVTFDFSGSRATASYTCGSRTVTGDVVDEFYQFFDPTGKTTSGVVTPPSTPDPAPSSPSTGQTFTTVANKDAVVLADKVNVRKSAVISGTNIITTLNKNKKVVVIAKSTDWYKIKFTYNGVTKTGYIWREYVGIGKRPSTVSFSLKKYYGNRIKISWKKQAGVSGYKVKRYNASKGKYVTIKTITGDSTLSYMDTGLKNGVTYKYRVYAYKTWKHDSSYTLYSPKPTAKSLKTCSYMLAKTTGTLLNVRKGPGTNYGILKTLSKAGVEVRVYALVNSWYKVKLKISGVWKTGYIIKNYVKL